MKNNLTKKGYNKAAETYSAQRDQFADQKYLDVLIPHLKKGGTILDVGCGAGKPIDEYLAKKGFAINGIDISERQIALAQKNIPSEFFEVKDMSSFKEYEYCVDAIVSFYAIFHIPREDHVALFKQFATFMPKGGYILVTMGANGEDPGSEQEYQGAKMFYSFYNTEKNTELIKEAGFEILFNEVATSGGEKHQIILGKI